MTKGRQRPKAEGLSRPAGSSQRGRAVRGAHTHLERIALAYRHSNRECRDHLGDALLV